jgi:hypothetical protein
VVTSPSSTIITTAADDINTSVITQSGTTESDPLNKIRPQIDVKSNSKAKIRNKVTKKHSGTSRLTPLIADDLREIKITSKQPTVVSVAKKKKPVQAYNFGGV